jgi:hypothetical protein
MYLLKPIWYHIFINMKSKKTQRIIIIVIVALIGLATVGTSIFLIVKDIINALT